MNIPRSHDFFVLRGEKDGGNADELKLDQADLPRREETVDDIGSNPQRLGEHMVAQMDLQQPFEKGGPRVPVHGGER